MKEARALELTRETIAQYFPEIDQKSVKVSFVRKTDFYMAVRWHLLHYQLDIDELSLELSEPAFRGCLAHELAHIVHLKQASIFKRIISTVFGEDVTSEERKADHFVIAKKLGPELLQFHHEHNKVYRSFKKSEGLTRTEIKKLLKQSRKR